MKKIYERNLNSSVCANDKGELIIKASLLDLNHSMRVTITVDTKTDLIVEASADITKAPLTICQKTLDRVQSIVGLKLERGINKRLAKALGGPCGCTHLYELALNAVRLSFNIKLGREFNWDEWVSRTLDEDKFIENARPHLENSCLPFKTDKES